MESKALKAGEFKKDCVGLTSREAERSAEIALAIERITAQRDVLAPLFNEIKRTVMKLEQQKIALLEELDNLRQGQLIL